jgi:NADH-quinone oxidoreductase subunit M
VVQLDLMILLPALAALTAVVAGRLDERAPKWIALVGVLAQLVLVATLSGKGVWAGARILGLDGTVTRGVWQTAIDGLSMPLVALTVFIGLVAVVASWRITERPGTYFALILALQAAVTGVFLAESLLLFYIAWESVLIPMYFLIGGWGSANRKHAATKFLIYTFAAGTLMLVGLILTLVQVGGGTSISGIVARRASITLPSLVFWLFTIGFLVKLPVVPFHTWLPDAHTEAPTAGSIILAGVMLKMGGYGLLRIALPLAPSAFEASRGLLAALGIIGIVYGAAMAFVQTDLKRLVAFSSVSHMGFVVLAISVGTPEALSAAMLAMVSHGFVAGLLFLLVGALYERTHTRELGRFGGLGKVVPLWGTAFMFAALASLGLPGLSGFPGEFVTIIGSFSAFGWWTAIATIGLVLAAAYNLRAVRGSVQGPIGEFDALPDLNARELGLVSAFAAGIVIIGVQPHLVVQGAQTALTVVSHLVNGGA